VGFNRIVDGTTARLVAESHYDDLIGPGYTDEALAILRRKRNLRIVEIRSGSKSAAGNAETSSGDTRDFRRISGGFLVQSPDNLAESDLAIRIATERAPTADELTDLTFAWRAVKHVRSNAIVLARNRAIVGVGAGQMSRVDSVDLAIRKAGTRASGSVLASDAYFAFADGPELAASAGVTAIIQPGGSVRDDDIVKVVNRHNLAMIFTGQRHFKH
jgi:phosphoribosylaminoimidazolecarboxamide formyltransferase/IMP cyclohydrolase